MKRFWIVIAAMGLLLANASALDLLPRFGNFGGKPRAAKPEAPFDIQSTNNLDKNTRWFPTYIRWAPDDTHLLVSLCHVNRPEYCRIGKYWIADKRWELLNLKPRTTYLWPSYSPDGKQIVAVVAPVNDDYRFAQRPALYLLSADGKQETKLIDTIAEKPSFSDDGKKIIYWRMYGGGGADVAMFDLVTSQERMLTKLIFYASERRGAAFFLSGGKKFVFAAFRSHAFAHPYKILKIDGQIIYKDGRAMSEPDPVLDGTKFDFDGPNRNVIGYVADTNRGVLTKEDILHVDLLWPKQALVEPNDVSRKGEILYLCGPRCYEEKKIAGVYRANGLTLNSKIGSRDSLLLLRPAREDAQDTVSFFIPNLAPQIAAISNDHQRVAFGEARDLWHPKNQIGITLLNEASPTFIDWPRLNLDPAAMQSSSQ